MKKRQETMIHIFLYIFLMAMIMIGGLLGVYLIGKQDGQFSFELDFFELAFAAVVGTVGGAIISFLYSKWRKKRNGNLPEIDERSMSLLKKYFLIVLYFVLIGSGALLLILYAMGVHTIETGMLIVYMMVLYIVIGIGAVVVKQF